jgi:hypothetical protein
MHSHRGHGRVGSASFPDVNTSATDRRAKKRWGKINIMPQMDQELNQLTYHFTAWAVGINVRLETIETLIRSKLAATEDEWNSAVAEAKVAIGQPGLHEMTTDSLTNFLRRLTKQL